MFAKDPHDESCTGRQKALYFTLQWHFTENCFQCYLRGHCYPLSEVMVMLHTGLIPCRQAPTGGRPRAAPVSPHKVQGVIALIIKPVLSMSLSQATHWMGSNLETNCDCCIWGSDPTLCPTNGTPREAVTEPFLPAHIIFIWLGHLQSSSFMAASNQGSLMRENKWLIDALINENLVYCFYCDMPCFGILQKIGI